MENVHHLVSRFLFHAFGKELEIHDITFQSGGCINMSVKVVTDLGAYFIKWNELELKNLFEKEVSGLKVLRGKSSLIVPEVVNYGVVEEKIYLMMEFLEQGADDRKAQERLGEGLAQLHSFSNHKIGFEESNYIGKLLQNNDYHSTWIEFFKEKRLGVQLGLAIYEYRVDQAFVDQFKRFLDIIHHIIPESKPVLLHGDLWSGNTLSTINGPAIFDPAVYYGAAEMDLAMTKLFGGFSDVFYDAYRANSQLNPQFDELADIYNLYPLMVHVNLFGVDSGYLASVKRIISRYL